MAAQEKSLDPRVVRSRSLLKAALLELIKEKKFQDITIQDIADRSTLNRVTFYLHYDNKYDLLKHLTRDLIKQEQQTISQPEVGQEGVSYEQSLSAIERYFEFIQSNADMLRSLMGENGVLAFVHDLENMIFDLNLSRFQRTMETTSEPDLELEMTFRHLAGGMIGIIRWWLEKDLPLSPREMAEKIISINQLGYYHSLDVKLYTSSNE